MDSRSHRGRGGDSPREAHDREPGSMIVDRTACSDFRAGITGSGSLTGTGIKVGLHEAGPAVALDRTRALDPNLQAHARAFVCRRFPPLASVPIVRYSTRPRRAGSTASSPCSAPAACGSRVTPTIHGSGSRRRLGVGVQDRASGGHIGGVRVAESLTARRPVREGWRASVGAALLRAMASRPSVPGPEMFRPRQRDVQVRGQP